MIALYKSAKDAKGSFVASLLEMNKEAYDAMLEHPFVDGMGKGTLDKEAFCYYCVQDFLYLIDYSRVFALGVIKAHDSATMGRFARYLDENINAEAGAHLDYLGGFGISASDIERDYTSDLVTKSYTSYMFGVASQGALGHVAIALLSCALGYEYIAANLEARYGHAHPYYGAWIETYISAEYIECAHFLAHIVDDVARRASPSERAYFASVFRTCSVYEYRFWDNCYHLGDDGFSLPFEAR